MDTIQPHNCTSGRMPNLPEACHASTSASMTSGEASWQSTVVLPWRTYAQCPSDSDELHRPVMLRHKIALRLLRTIADQVQIAPEATTALVYSQNSYTQVS